MRLTIIKWILAHPKAIELVIEKIGEYYVAKHDKAAK